jgi:hypothetical protein
MTVKMFCDEFGNTGGRLLDPEQPVLVYAFILLQPAALATVSGKVQQLLQEGAASPSELKSSQLLKSPLGRRRFGEIGRVVVEHGARVCLSIVEKRYQACAMIAETYLDPELHEFAPAQMRNRQSRQRFADACYNTLPDERLVEFLSAVDADIPEDIATIGKRFFETMRLHPDGFVCDAAHCIETRADHVFRYRQLREGLPKNANVPASQYLAFHPGLDCLEACLRAMGETGELLRDHDAQFGDVLDAAFAAGRQLDSLAGARAYGAERQLNSIESCACASSAQELGIQLADLAAGVFGRVCRDLCLRRLPSADLYRIAESWSETLSDMKRHHVMVSDAMLVELAPAIFGREYIRVA